MFLRLMDVFGRFIMTADRQEHGANREGTLSREIEPAGELDAEVDAPPSKAFTLRGLFLATLAEGQSRLKKALNAEDQQHAAEALSMFGARISYEEGDYIVEGTGGDLSKPEGTVYTGQSGVTTRFIIPLAALAPGTTTIDGDEQMRGRPVGDLVTALQDAGVSIDSRDGFLPVRVEGGTWTSDRVRVPVEESSQYLSGVLISAPYVPGEVILEMEGTMSSRPYVDITLEMMEEFGSRIERREENRFCVGDRHQYAGREFQIEGDYTSDSYFLAAPAVTGGRIRVRNLNPDSLQGDQYFLDLLSQMGCEVRWVKDTTVEVRGGDLQGITMNMRDYPDLVPTLAVMAAFAEGKTRITNVAHLAHKESDRLQSTAQNLRAAGIDVEVRESSMIIQGGRPEPAEIDPMGDHRIAMSFTLLGLGVPGIIINDPHVVNKSFPGFFDTLQHLYE